MNSCPLRCQEPSEWMPSQNQAIIMYLFRHRSKKTSKLRVTGLCEENSYVTGEFPSQRASSAENVSIWWHHHVLYHFSTLRWRNYFFWEMLAMTLISFSRKIPAATSEILDLSIMSLGLYSLSGKTSYRQISWSLEAARLGVMIIAPLWNLTGTAGGLSNFRAIGKV